MSLRNFLYLVALSGLSAACRLTPPFEAPQADVPEAWHYAQNDAAALLDPGWWRAFADPELEALISHALAYNNDLAAATRRVEQARAQAKLAGADLLPGIGTTASLTDRHNDAGDTQRKFAQISIAYEVDLWGANRAKRDAGRARWLSTIFARDALRLVVSADVAQVYFNVLASAEQIRIAERFLVNTEQTLSIVTARFKAGAVSNLDVAQQQSLRANAQADLERLKQQKALADNALSILLGDKPQAQGGAATFTGLQIPAITALQPSELLQRRPDVKQIEGQLQAAHADVAIARAAFYPKLQLSLDGVLANPQPAGVLVSMAAALLQPIYQGGRLEGALANARARHAELVEIWQQTLLTAFKEVEDAAAVRQYSGLRQTALQQAVGQAELAYRIADARYRAGAIEFQALLTAQRDVFTAQTHQVQARLDVLNASVQLFKALGGGWQPASAQLPGESALNGYQPGS
ncbi:MULTISPECIES: efflux transporter outer membrane subunit [Methylomonas]|uniref:efflux transporter outer membrane subunit n=1 Tax=Methylomonas TaxID=416 RepID=UPI001232EE76|nr:efflux transporter outer membrane subunit [Methylomonas rhizoryzae]